MVNGIDVFVEVGRKRVFAGAVAWPGWCRVGRDEESALETLAAYGERYARGIASAGLAFEPPTDASAFTVIERIAGDGATDFGVPHRSGQIDERTVTGAELDQMLAMLLATWVTFGEMVDAHAGVELRLGPRGGGRSLAKIADHVIGAQAGYQTSTGGRFKPDEDAPHEQQTARVLDAVIELWQIRAGGGDPPRTPRPGKTFWTLPYFARRSAWHVLDHAWESEDRAT